MELTFLWLQRIANLKQPIQALQYYQSLFKITDILIQRSIFEGKILPTNLFKNKFLYHTTSFRVRMRIELILGV
ncbi:hypothetical protein [Helicobacter pylori]|uniref:hypothetical protein n=1 Tax=Helicobacter pylori TaxID=210 RepID=UPI003F91AF9B